MCEALYIFHLPYTYCRAADFNFWKYPVIRSDVSKTKITLCDLPSLTAPDLILAEAKVLMKKSQLKKL